jgi:hypothetical protein
MAQTAPPRRDPLFEQADLARVGVQMLHLSQAVLGCKRCGARWSPEVSPGGRLPQDWWQWPQGCNRSA